jgi:hypothetical protein
VVKSTNGIDPLHDELEKEYLEKLKTGELKRDMKEIVPPPHDPLIHEPIDPTAPGRYRDLRLEKFWYRAGCKSKRRHRKSEGSVGFLELTKMISRRWASIDELMPEVKEYCQRIANSELDEYKKEVEKHKAALKGGASSGKITVDDDSDDNSDTSDDEKTEETVDDSKSPQTKPTTSTLPPPAQKPDKPPLPPDNPALAAELEQLSQTPRTAREVMLDPRFSSRFTDLSNMSMLLGGFGTPRDTAMAAARGGAGVGLPPPPFAGNNLAGPSSDMERRMAVMINAERRLAGGMDGGGGDEFMNLGNDLPDRATILANARRRMQMQMQMQMQMDGGNGNMMGRGRMDGMFPGGMSDMDRGMMMNDDYFPSGRGSIGGDYSGGGISQMRNRFMERFGNDPDNMPRNEEDFDNEVERFLSCLGKEIKESHRRRSLGMDGDGLVGAGGNWRGGAGGGMDGAMMGPSEDRMMNRMMMMEMMRRQQENDDPQLPEFDRRHGSRGSNPSDR